MILNKNFILQVISMVLWKVKVLVTQYRQIFVTPWTVACQAPLSMGLPRQEYWSGLPFLLQGIFLTQGSNPGFLHCKQIHYHLRHQGSPSYFVKWDCVHKDSLEVKL